MNFKVRRLGIEEQKCRKTREQLKQERSPMPGNILVDI